MYTLLMASLAGGLILLGVVPRCTAQIPLSRGELRIADTNGERIVQNVLECLVEIDHQGQLVPRLAAGWQWLDDHTLVMSLRHGVTFHNGEVFDAAMVKRNWEEYQYRQENFASRSGLPLFPTESRLEVLDPSTVRFVFTEPDSAALLKLSSLRIMNRQFWQESAVAGYSGTHRSLGPWGTGPYKWVEGYAIGGAQPSPRIVLEANLAYWDVARFPRLQRIVFDTTLTPDAALELVKTSEGRVDLVAGVRPLETLRVAESPFAKVVKERSGQQNVFGLFNMQKPGSPWQDMRLRQAVNAAINREDLIRYAAKGNGTIVPALLPRGAFGYAPDLVPYPFDPARARTLLQEAGYANGLTLTLIAPKTLEVQATVVSKMLEQVGFTVHRSSLDEGAAFFSQVNVNRFGFRTWPDWDIALLTTTTDAAAAPTYVYERYALGGNIDWVTEQPELRRLYDQLLRTVDSAQQQGLIRQMEEHTRDQAYFLFLYNPLQLYAVNKAVEFVPHPSGGFSLAETTVTDQHWSVREAPQGNMEEQVSGQK
jgi:peptide/nickel transport system substrate-binding protein